MKANIRKCEDEFAKQLIIERYGVEPDTEVELVDTKPFVSSYYNTPEMPHFLCKLPNGTMKIIMATDLIIQEPTLEDWPQGVLYYEESEWTKFRREAAKNLMCAIIAGDKLHVDLSFENVAYNAIRYADELIKQLKKE